MNHKRGAFPLALRFLFEKPSSSSALAPFPLSANVACFLSSVVSVVCLRDVSSSSSSESEESEPERLSSRSVLSVQYGYVNPSLFIYFELHTSNQLFELDLRDWCSAAKFLF